MGRKPCCAKVGLNRGAWSAWEDKILVDYIEDHGEGKWRDLPKRAGLNRCGKSCRLRWLNYLRPDIKRGNISVEEEELILRLHRLLGNRWALIAGRLPGRTDNEIKNYWNTNLRKKVQGKEKTSRQSRKPLESSKELDDQPSRMKKLKSPLEPPRVIRTKAVRCNKVSLPQINHTTADPEKPSLSVFQEANSPDLLKNLDVDYVSLLEALDFQDVVQDRDIGNRCDNTTTLGQCCGCGGRNDVSCQPQSSASEHENLMDRARQEHNGDSHDDPFQSEDDAFDLIDLATIF